MISYLYSAEPGSAHWPIKFDIMNNKNQIPFRFSEATAMLINKGLSLYEKESKTEKISRNQLLEICIKKSVIEFPNQVRNLNNDIRNLKKYVLHLQEEKESLQRELSKIKELIKFKTNIDQELAQLVS
jgi:predicted RNase H-like nuclease (RuvC/YqgF family)